MTYLRFLVSIFILVSLSGKAQSTFLLTDTLVLFSGQSQLSDVVSGQVKFYNISGTTLSMRWVREQENIPPWWRSSVCTEYYCFSIPDDSASWTLLPGDSDLLYIHIYPYGNTGLGDVVLKLFDTNNPTQAQRIRFSVDVVASIHEQSDINFHIWPTLVNDNIEVKIGQLASGGTLEVMNTEGKVVSMQFIPQGINSILLTTDFLPQGYYLIRYIDNKGQYASQRFIKQ